MNRQELLQNAKPILFNTEMVKAILEGKKSCTRRIIKPQPPQTGMYFDGLMPLNQAPKEGNAVFRRNQNDGFCVWKPPYQVGDILWVRETWGEGYDKGTYIYKADDKLADLPNFRASTKLIYRPSIHMPKDAARIFLKVTDVKVERLHQARYFECIAEGIPYNQYEKIVVQNFANLWDSTVKKADIDRYGWKANPWVWVIEFERVTADE